MTNRREFIVGGAAAIGGLAAVGAPIRSMLGARGTASIGAKGWTNPYVTDGLIAMWDGEWNVGGGVHESAPLTWKDLSGNGLDMISNGNPIFYDNYIAPTQLSEMFHTDETDLCDGILANATITMEVVGMCITGKTGPKMCLFGGSTSNDGFNVTFACPDPTRIGFSCRLGTASPNAYSTQNPFGKVSMYSDGLTIIGRYLSSSGDFTRSISVTAPITNYASKRFAVGYRYSYYQDGPMINGERVYSIRVYDRALTEAEKAKNDAVDFKRFGI